MIESRPEYFAGWLLLAVTLFIGIWRGGHCETTACEMLRCTDAQLIGTISGKGRCDINYASAQELLTLPGMTTNLVALIIERRQHTPFTQTDEVRQLPGLTPAQLLQILPLLSLETPYAQ